MIVRYETVRFRPKYDFVNINRPWRMPGYADHHEPYEVETRTT